MYTDSGRSSARTVSLSSERRGSQFASWPIITYILGWMISFEALFLLLPLAVSFLYQEWTFAKAVLMTIGICALLAIALMLRKPERFTFYFKEGMIIVGLGWIVLSALGALPFWLSGEIPSYVDALFETISGFTTTGSTILADVGKLSYGALFWRSFTHWIGGMGILVFLLALVPGQGGSFIYLLKAESPGPSVGKLVPRLRQTAMHLYFIYLALTLTLIVLLLLFEMPLFDAVTIAMGTAGTGGFAVRSDGFASYTIVQQFIITIFMLLFGINFNFYFLILRRRFKQAMKMEEVGVYLLIITAATLLITFTVLSHFESFWLALHHVFFTVTSIITTTGFSTVDFNIWAPFALVIIVLLMFIGACAGSTGGGFKISRILILIKGVFKEFHTLIHPRSVRKIRMDGKIVPHEVIRSVTIFFTLYVIIFVVSLLLISLDGFDLTSSFTAVAATLNNIGPALGSFGPMETFAGLSSFSKLVLAFCMLAGRLEILPILFLFVVPLLQIHQQHPTEKAREFVRSRKKDESDQAETEAE